MRQRAFRHVSAGLAVAAGLLSLTGCIVPPRLVELSRLTMSDGSTFAIEQGPGPSYILVHNISSTVETTPLDALGGMSGLSLPYGGTIGQNTILIAEGSAPGCQVRTVLLVPVPGSVREFTLQSCDQHYRMMEQQAGNVNAMVVGQTAPPYAVYSYANGTLAGPITPHATQSVARQRGQGVARPRLAKSINGAEAGMSQPAAVGWVAPVGDPQ